MQKMRDFLAKTRVFRTCPTCRGKARKAPMTSRNPDRDRAIVLMREARHDPVVTLALEKPLLSPRGETVRLKPL